MFNYVLGDGRGNFIAKCGNNYQPLYGIENAVRFETREKAANVRKSCVAQVLRSAFDVIAVKIDDPQPAPPPQKTSAQRTKTNKDVNVIKQIAASEINNGEIPEWLEKVKSIVELSETLEGRRNELIELLSKVDLEISDIQHYIELTNCNAYQGWLTYSMLKNRLEQRRKYKDEIEIIRSISSSSFAQQSVVRLNGMVSHLHTRTYSPRVLTGLFDMKTVSSDNKEGEEIPIGLSDGKETA